MFMFTSTIAGLFSEFSLNSILNSRDFYLLSKAQLIIFPSTSTLIMVIFNTHRLTHNDPSHLPFCQSNLFLHMCHIRSLSPHIHLLLDDALHALVLFESNARCPTSTAVLHLSRNLEEPQLSHRQLFLYLEL